MDNIINLLVLWIVPFVVLIFSAILHEMAHGYVANRLGDPTAKLMGRLTLNPGPHIDPLMTILLPLMLIFSGSPVIFGGAKPVPVNPFNLREGRKDMALVSLAGPLTNLLIAVIAGLLLKILLPTLFFQSFFVALFTSLLQIILRINLLLAIFNLIPLPPLDGSKIFALLLPEREANSYLNIGSLGMLILFGWLLLGGPLGLESIMGSIFSFAYSLFGLSM